MSEDVFVILIVILGFCFLKLLDYKSRYESLKDAVLEMQPSDSTVLLPEFSDYNFIVKNKQWRLVAPNNKTIARSVEFSSNQALLKNIAIIKEQSPAANIKQELWDLDGTTR